LIEIASEKKFKVSKTAIFVSPTLQWGSCFFVLYPFSFGNEKIPKEN